MDYITEVKGVTGEFVTFLDDTYYRIRNYDQMPPFFVSLVSSDDHWLFIATTGGLTAGRINADHALFPYYTVDRITEDADNTGSKTVVRVLHDDGTTALWEPFADRVRSPYRVVRNLYKNVSGTSLVFEETNLELGLQFRYAWRTSDRYGIVKTAWLTNQRDHQVTVTLTDGIQNVLPAHVAAATQNAFSVLLDAYKRNELDVASGLGIYSLSSRLTDLAEPSESLRANTVWQVGLPSPTVFLSSTQLEDIRRGQDAQLETNVRGQRGAYFAQATLELAPNAMQTWHIAGEVDQDATAVANLKEQLRTNDGLYDLVAGDIRQTRDALRHIVGGADGIQISGDPLSSEHHFANVLFNVMRGGTFANHYQVEKSDFLDYVETHIRSLPQRDAAFFTTLPAVFTIQQLKDRADAQDDPDLTRLCYTYLPLTFSRRHGDPSRPWNRFSIHLKNPDGSPQLNYEGNWRDIFQNWEALAYSYPAFIDGMIAVFLNATTIDGYNPYRIMRDGIDWEVPEPSNPWANIGYWSDHQIIYLQKLMEVCERFYPGKLRDLLTRPFFAYANVPYRIKPYAAIVQDPYNTIVFDRHANETITERAKTYGTDGRLLMDAQGSIIYATLTEKLLNLLLAKLVNFVPDGGIWMNTQRPEWNDANNALVGKGLSVVTTNYLRRFTVFVRRLIAEAPDEPDELVLSQEIYTLLQAVQNTLVEYQTATQPITDKQRRTIVDALGQAGSDYRWRCYERGLSGERVSVTKTQINAFLDLTEAILNQTLQVNQRDDALYHAYNILRLGVDTAQINHLQVMLEGQVAALSSGLMNPEDALALLRSLRQSPLYRADQHSYILYPDRELPGFLQKNTFDASDVSDLALVEALVERNDPRLIVRDVHGDYHFSGDIRNARDIEAILDDLAAQPELAEMVAAESAAIYTLFENVFQHDKFTGRSGSFFAYEGLGSIYWHMVSKLLLAVQENIQSAAQANHKALDGLIDAYRDIRAGLSFNKTPDVYGAFPLDPYSHTPRDRGAKQPGMTGMVKEEIITRLLELGIVIQDGTIMFDPILIESDEWLQSPAQFTYWDVHDEQQQIDVPIDAFAFTLCQVPVIVQKSDQNRIVVTQQNGETITHNEHHLDVATGERLFTHDGTVHQLTIYVDVRSLTAEKG